MNDDASEKPDSPEFIRLKLLNKDFQCTVCDSYLFISKRIQVVYDEPHPYGLGRKKEFANSLVCKDCGYVHWFLPELVHERVKVNKESKEED